MVSRKQYRAPTAEWRAAAQPSDATDPGPAGVPLGFYLDDDPRIGVAIWCNACSEVRKFGMRETIARLDARGLVGRQVGVRELAGMIRRPCRCGASDWDSRPDFGPATLGLRR